LAHDNIRTLQKLSFELYSMLHAGGGMFLSTLD